MKKYQEKIVLKPNPRIKEQIEGELVIYHSEIQTLDERKRIYEEFENKNKL